MEKEAHNKRMKIQEVEKEDIFIPKSLGAAAKKVSVSVRDEFGKTRYCNLKEGSTIIKVKAFFGKGTGRKLIVAAALAAQYGGLPDDWQHVRGEGIVVDNNIERRAELHWFERDGAERIKIKVKRWF